MTKKEWIAYGVYAVVSLAVLAPLLMPGFILTLDMVFTPHLAMPDHVTSSYLFHAALHILNLVIPSEIIEKIILLAVLLLSMVGMHRLIRALPYPHRVGEWGIYIASVFFAINPFTYSRFMAGQYAVLLGYALLPWFVRLLLIFGRQPTIVNALKLSGLATIIGIVSIHTLGLVAVISVIAGVLAMRQQKKWGAYLRFGLGALVVFLVLSSYWLVPLVSGSGQTAETIHSFTAADTQAFATAGGSVVGKTGNVLRLQGFWAEDRGLYLLPQDRAVLWGLMSLIIMGVAITGGVVLWRRSRTAMVLVGASGLAGLLLATGLLSPIMNHLPLIAGYREPQKFAGLLALAYAAFLAMGIDALLRQARERNETLYALGAVAVLILPVLYMRVMFWGFDGQLSPRHYPADWSTVNELLVRDPDTFQSVFLPWHQYMNFTFAGRVIANPAPRFFDWPVLVSIDPEIDGASGGAQTQQQVAVAHLVGGERQSSDLASQLAIQDVKYILLAKDLDYQTYDFLKQLNGLELVADYPSLQVYKNLDWKAQ